MLYRLFGKDHSRQNVSLALGGGGARGFAHIIVLEIFDELGIKPQKIAGVSIGAIMAAAYASGLSGQEIREATLEVFGSRSKALSRLWQLRPRNFSELFATNFTQFNAQSILEAFAGDYILSNFSDLKIPLCVTAADYYGWREVTFEEGDLHIAVAASIAIPVLFQPVVHEGRVLVDGGVFNPLPFDHLDPNAFTIAVDVVGGPLMPDIPQEELIANGPPLPGIRDMIFDATQLVMQAITIEKLKNSRPNLLICPSITHFGVLDFLRAKEILAAIDQERDIIKRQIGEQLEIA